MWTVKKDILTDIINDTLEIVYFAGGEPLIIPYHYEMLDYMIKNDYAKNIELRYNTNLSTLKYKSVDLLKNWSSFKNITLSPSIDMIGEQGEYHRYGSKWNDIINNLNVDIISFSMSKYYFEEFNIEKVIYKLRSFRKNWWKNW